MEKLDEKVVIGVIREEWERRTAALREEMDTVYKPSKKGPEKPSISPGLKIKDKKEGILYTIDAVGRNHVILLTPEGRKIPVATETLEKDFELS